MWRAHSEFGAGDLEFIVEPRLRVVAVHVGDLPLGVERGVGNFTRGGQKLSGKARTAPVGGQPGGVGPSQRIEGEGAAAVQVEFQGEFQSGARFQVFQGSERHLKTGRSQSGIGNAGDCLAFDSVDVDGFGGNSFQVADADHQNGVLKLCLRIGEAGEAELRGKFKLPFDGDLTAVKDGLIEAAVTDFRIEFPGDVQRFRQESQLVKTDFLSHGHRRLRRRAEPLFADRDRQERPRYRLGGTPFPGDFIDRLIAVALPLRDQRVDHQRRNLEQQDDRADQH